MNRIHRGMALAMVAAVAVSACKKKPETVVPTNPTTNTPPPAETCNAACRDSISRANALRDSLVRAAELERARAAALEAARNTVTATIYFEYDASDIRSDARSALDSKLSILRSNPGLQIRISGHADERGSDQYNDALGQRRAASARRYLTDNGIDASRIAIVSYGEQRPAMGGSDENAWARNRRAEFEITAGTISTP